VSAAVNESNLTQRLRYDEPMSEHTSWRIGGPADVFFRPASLEELQTFLRDLEGDAPVHWVGLGSNVLVRDGGVRGVVICTLDLTAQIERVDERRVRAGAGLPCTRLARQCVRWQLGPAAFFAGIPGTVGGALAMNAGAFGGETWENVESVETIDRNGELRVRTPADFRVAYRSVSGARGEWFLAATFALHPDIEADMADIDAVMRERRKSQPLGQLSCGSVFRNPPGDFAARLIEAAGFKGMRVGGAVVSEKHANFIINTGSASAADIEQLIRQIRERVAAQSGVELELEVRLLGEMRAGEESGE
jgi:UDP-N-acetylmuramate dehydrogenase